MPYLSFNTGEKNAKRQAIAELREYSVHTRSFYLLLIGATILAIGGIFSDSIALLIASMIIAPLAAPILALGLGIVVGDWRVIIRTAGLLVTACVVALSLAVLATLLFNDDRVKDVYVTFAGSLPLSFIIAIVAGIIAAYGALNPKISSALTGVAIGVSLLPPLVATGIGFASQDQTLFIDGARIFGLNVLGVLIASIAVFLIVRIKSEYRSKEE